MRKMILGITVVLALLLIAVGGVAAHDDNDSHDAPPENASADEWGTWMEQHMTEQMGADAAEQMEHRMGMSYDEMGEHMAAHHNSSEMGDNSMMDGHGSGMGCH